MNEKVIPMDLEAELGEEHHILSATSNRVYGKHVLTTYALELTNALNDVKEKSAFEITTLGVNLVEMTVTGYDAEADCLKPFAAYAVAAVIDSFGPLRNDYKAFVKTLEQDGGLDRILRRAKG